MDFTPTEARAVRDYLLVKEREAARERCVEGGKTKGSAKFVDPDKGVAADKASAATGYSRETLRKVDAVVEAAEAEPEKFGPVVEEMDRTGKVDPAYRKVVDGNEPEPVQKKVKYPFLEIAKRAYLELNDKESKMFRKWLKNS